MRIVLDTNNLVSSLIGHPDGPSARLMDALKEGRLKLVTSQVQLDELSNTLAKPRIAKRLTPEESATFIEALPLIAEVVVPVSGVDVCRDPDDNLILATAIAGQAEVLVSGDDDLLTLQKVDGISILTARQALERLGKKEQGG